MKAYIINDKNSSVSALGVKNCHNSIKAYGSDIDLHPFQQTSPETIEDHAGIFGDISWNYPINDEVATDKELGINLKAYRTNDYKKVFIPKRPGEPDCTFANIEKIKKLLNWEPFVPIEEGVNIILKNIDYWKEAPVWTPETIKKETTDWFKYLGNE